MSGVSQQRTTFFPCARRGKGLRQGASLLFRPLLSSLLLFAAAPGQYALPWCSWISLLPLLQAISETTTRRQAFLLGVINGFCFYAGGLYWITTVLTTYGQLPWPLALPAMLLLAFYMALYHGIIGVALYQQSAAVLLWLAPTIWVGLDWVRSLLFTGFPWLDLAYSQYQSPHLLQIADLVGHHGLTFIIVLVNTLLSLLVTGFHRRGPIPTAGITAAALLLLAVAGYSAVRYDNIKTLLTTTPTTPVTAVQGNIDQELKWQQGQFRTTYQTYTQLSRTELSRPPEPTGALLLWPETALPFYPGTTPYFATHILPLLRQRQSFLLTGAVYEQPGGTTIYNRAILLAPDGTIAGTYDKRHLVPFGEYIPFHRFFPNLSPVVASMTDFTAGRDNTPLQDNNNRIGVLICFESIFPDLARRQVANGANLLVNLTNDAWFGRSSAPWQHFAMSVLRAVENRRAVARAANTGISGFIDPLGRILRQTPLFVATATSSNLPLSEIRSIYSRWGYWFAPGCLLVAGILLWRGRLQRRQPA